MKSLKIILSALVLLCVAACQKPAEGGGESVSDELSLSVSSLSFGPEALEQQVSVTSSKAITALSNSPAWLSVTKSAFASGETILLVKVTENTSKDSRSGYVSITCGSLNEKLNVTQDGAVSQPDVVADFLEEPTLPDNEAVAFTRRLGMGWNLGNQLEANNNGAISETCWGNPLTTQKLFDSLKAKGFKSVRIPLSWMNSIGPAPDYTLPTDRLDRVAEVVGYAHKAGLNVIINMHHDDSSDGQGGWLRVGEAAKSESANAQITEKYVAVWTQVAERFKNEGDYLMFESYNELQDGKWGWGDNLTDGGKQYSIINGWAQAFVDAVRATGGNNAVRYLGVSGYAANPDFTMDHLELPCDSAQGRLAVGLHCYDPYSYCLEDKYHEWGHTASTGNACPDGNEKTFVELYAKIKAKYIDNNILVYMAETGCVNRSYAKASELQRYYIEFTYRCAKAYGLAPFYWDNGAKGSGKECNGLLDHATGDYINNSQSMLDAMKKAVYTNASSYNLRTIYNGAPNSGAK